MALAQTTGIDGAPCLDDARAAARAISEAGAAQVLVFGSVARGEATPHSDIDLVAVFDDLGDYSRRRDLKTALGRAAAAAAGRPVDVTVTDRPEWKRRTESVSASFEAKIAGDARILVDRPPTDDVRWDKDIGRPMTNLQEAEAHSYEASLHLDGLLLDLRPDIDEIASAPRMRFVRFRRLCYESSMAVESLTKAWVALGGQYPRRSHQISLLFGQLGDDPEAAVSDLLAHHGLVPDEVSKWRIEGTYVGDVEEQQAEAERLVGALLRLACEMGEMTADAIRRAGGQAADLQEAASRAASMLAASGVRTGGVLEGSGGAAGK